MQGAVYASAPVFRSAMPGSVPKKYLSATSELSELHPAVDLNNPAQSQLGNSTRLTQNQVAEQILTFGTNS